MKLKNKIDGLRAIWHFVNRWQLIINRTFFPEDSLLVYRKDGVEFLVDHAASDHNGTRLCLISDIYTRFLPMMDLGETISVFDLGANGGGFPLMLHLRGKRFSRLVCVELNPNTFERLRYNVSRNISGDISLIQAAVCGRHQSFNLRLGRGDISDTIYQDTAKPPAAGLREFVVEGRTFDDLFHSCFGEETADICKMDIEGAEYEVLSSPESACLRKFRYLIVELHVASVEHQQRFDATLSAMGFANVEASNNRIPSERLYRNRALA